MLAHVCGIPGQYISLWVSRTSWKQNWKLSYDGSLYPSGNGLSWGSRMSRTCGTIKLNINFQIPSWVSLNINEEKYITQVDLELLVIIRFPAKYGMPHYCGVCSHEKRGKKLVSWVVFPGWGARSLINAATQTYIHTCINAPRTYKHT